MWEQLGVSAVDWLLANNLTHEDLSLLPDTPILYTQMNSSQPARRIELSRFAALFESDFLHSQRVALSQPFLPRVAEGELSIILSGSCIVGAEHRISRATEPAGSRWYWYEHLRFHALGQAPSAAPAWRWVAHQLNNELSAGGMQAGAGVTMFDALNVDVEQLPAMWAVGVILGEDGQYYGTHAQITQHHNIDRALSITF